MSIAETKHVFEAIADGGALDVSLNEPDPEEKGALERLTQTSPPTSGPIIAVDLDDVLSQTNQQVATCKPNRSLSKPVVWCRRYNQGITKRMAPI